MKSQITNNIIKRALAVLLFLIITTIMIKFKIHIPCLFHKITNLYCPGCGITRMLASMFKLDFYQAFRYNPLCFILFPFLTPYIIYTIYTWLFNKENKLIKHIPNKLMISIIVLLVIFGILRNTDAYSWLGPTIIH